MRLVHQYSSRPPSLPYVQVAAKRASCAALAVAVVLAGAAAAGGAPAPVAAAAPAAVLPGLSPAAPAPTAAGVARALAGPLADPGLGAAPHVEVIDARTGRVLLDRLGTVPTIPASTEKLLTAAAALTVLGPRTRFTTRAMTAGADLFLVGGGDPTLSTQPVATGYPTVADLNALARGVAARHLKVTRVVAVAPQYGGPDEAPGWSASYLPEGQIARVRSLIVDEAKFVPGLGPSGRVADPVGAAAQAFQNALAAAGAPVTSATTGTLLPPSARLAASVTSPPVSALVERMLNFSDADIAEGLARQVAVKLGQPATFAGVAEALTTVAHRLGLLTAGDSRILDGSGLSRDNAIAPASLTRLLRLAVTGSRPQLRTMLAALPVAGFTGTLAARFTGAAASGAGQVRAKTGWLNGAAALAGLVTTADGRLLIFAALAPAQIRSAGESALDRLAATLATCGCR